MKIEVLPIEDHQVKLTIEVENDLLEDAKQKAARKMASKARIPGFRPGKAPYPIILRHFGESAVLEEAIEVLANDIYPKALDESKINPYGPGALQNIPSTEPLVLEFVVPLEAEVQLGEYRSVRLPYNPPVVTEDEVNEVIVDLRERSAILETVERPADKGDQVTILIEANRLNADTGEDPELIRERSVPIIIHEVDDPNEWPYPGFSLNLVDTQCDEKKLIEYEYSEDTIYQQLVGVSAQFNVTIQEISSRTLPELNDEFAKTMGDYETLDSLIKDIRSSIETNKKATYDTEYAEEVLDEIIKGVELKYPPAMLERELDMVMRNLESRLAEQKLDMDLYLKTRQMDLDALRDEYRPSAEEELTRSLVIYEISEKEKVEVSPDEFNSEATRTVDSLANVLDKKDSRRLSDRNVINNIAGNVMADLMTRKTLEKIRDIGSGAVDEKVEDILEEGDVQEINILDETPSSLEEIIDVEADVSTKLESKNALEEDLENVTEIQEEKEGEE